MTPTTELSFDNTTLEAAQRNILANSTEMVRRLNEDLKNRYDHAYADYVTNMHSGGVVPPERRHAPIVPNAWELAPPNEDGFVFYQVGHTPVAPQPSDTYYAADNQQANTEPNHIMLGSRIFGNWFSAIKGDTMPSGMDTPPITSQDGVLGVFTKFGAPVGQGWYLLKTTM